MVIACRGVNPPAVVRIQSEAVGPGLTVLMRSGMYSICVRRSAWLRPLTCLWALWFGVVLAVPAALPTCPAHGEHVGHRMEAGATSGGLHHQAPSHETHDACTCLGACCSAPAVALVLGAPAELPAPRVSTQTSRPRFPDAPLSRSAARYAHPFANGPPAAIAA